MKKKEFMKMVLFSAVAVCLTSCAMNPKVTADLMGTYPQRSADQVVIYEEGDTVPANATVVGKVKVTDGGMSSPILPLPVTASGEPCCSFPTVW